jgi:predicted DNA-binding transcriptional regulator YafY
MARNDQAGDTLLRQWHMLRAIPRHPRRIGVRELQASLDAAGFGVSARTIQRDLMELSNSFPLVSDEREKPYGWSWQARAPVFDLPNLSNHEALAFAMVEDYLRPLLPHVLLDQLQPYFRIARTRIANGHGSRGSRSWLGKIAAVQPTQALIPPAIDARVQAVVTDALLDDRRLEASYRRKGEREARQYVLNPLALMQRGPITYLLASVGNYDDALLFALHRFERASVAEGKVRRPKTFDLKVFLKDGWAHYGSGKSIRLDVRFSAAAAEHLYETPLSEDQKLGGESDGRVRLRATVADTPQLRWWLLAFGDAVEVLAPAMIRQWFVATTKAMAAMYDEERAGDLPLPPPVVAARTAHASRQSS